MSAAAVWLAKARRAAVAFSSRMRVSMLYTLLQGTVSIHLSRSRPCRVLQMTLDYANRYRAAHQAPALQCELGGVSERAGVDVARSRSLALVALKPLAAPASQRLRLNSSHIVPPQPTPHAAGSSSLAAAAQSYADKLASQGCAIKMEHSGAPGELLYWETGDDMYCRFAVIDWYGEVSEAQEP